MDLDMNKNELMHYGVIGMKWGVRRYQNKDGSLTSVGKKHRKISPEEKKERNDRAFSKDVKTGKDKDPISRAEKITKDSGKIIDESFNIYRNVSNIKNANRSKQDLSKMSDSELKSRINRMNLEKQYRQLSEPEISKGSIYVKNILEIGGSLTAIGGSALAIMLAIKEIKG